MLSVSGRYPLTAIFGSTARSAEKVASTAAAPPMSLFIAIIPVADLSERPPESKVMPLPTRASLARGRSGSQCSSTSRGGWFEPRLTPRIPPQPSSARSASSSTLTRRPSRSATSTAISASLIGVSDPPGSLTRSRAKATASAMATPRATAALTLAPAGPTSTTRARATGSGVERNLVSR